MKTLAARRVAVFGLGGVGSCAAEALTRSGIGHLTLVDFDRVFVTTMNRQLHALTGTLGAPKAGLMAARVREINPGIEVLAVERFYDKTTSAQLLDPRPDVVIDAIDNVTAKMHPPPASATVCPSSRPSVRPPSWTRPGSGSCH
jgi:tRNA A37 threonylcarbamoyladenosine dehydratase